MQSISHIRLAVERETEKPKNTPGNVAQNFTPHVEGRWVNLIELVEVTEHYCVFW
jgi:hypothetical protein